jgi:predicted ATPase
VIDAFIRPMRGAPRLTDVTDLLHRGRGADVVFAVQARLPAEVETTLASSGTATRPPPTHLRYELRLEMFSYGLRVAAEHLFLFADGWPPAPGTPMQGEFAGGSRDPGRRWRPVIKRRSGLDTVLTAETTSRGGMQLKLRIEPEQLALASVPADESLFPAARWFIGLLRARSVCYDPDWEALRRPAPPGDPAQILPDARNTPWLALALRKEDPAGFRLWVDHVRTALVQVTNIEVEEREEDHHAYFVVEYAGGHRVTSSGLSDGTVRILALSVLPYLPASALPRLLVTEEPENGIHPQAIEAVLTSLRAVRDSQVWISTHSPVVLAARRALALYS